MITYSLKKHIFKNIAHTKNFNFFALPQRVKAQDYYGGGALT
jgi:hypothetical protein